jgi:pyrimidine dimer DNA glycosylase
MQTFLPYPDFAASAAVLDGPRLGKQRVEALQVLRALTWETYGWKRHPAVRMWEGYVRGLAAYGFAVCAAWTGRGHSDTCAATMSVDLAHAGVPPPLPQEQLAALGELPPWLGDDRVHASHRAALVRKDPAFYGRVFPDADPSLQYFWPV